MVVAVARPTKRPHTANLIARKAVPADLRHLIGKTEFVRSLPTAKPSEATRPYAETLAGWEAQVAAARAKLRGDPRPVA